MTEKAEQLSLPVDLGNGSSPLSIWVELHSAMKFWAETYSKKWGTAQQGTLLRALDVYREKAKSLCVFPAERLEMLSQGLGWTTLSPALLSWCQDADLTGVLEKWRGLDYIPQECVACDFPSLLINPAILPKNDLRAIITAGRDETGVAILLASKLEPVHVDIPDTNIAEMPARLRQMVIMRAPRNHNLDAFKE